MFLSAMSASDKGRIPARFSGIQNTTSGAYLISRHLLSEDRSPVILVVPDSTTAENFERDLSFFIHGEDLPENEITGGDVCAPAISKFISWEVLPFDELSPAQEISAERLFTLHKLQVQSCSVTIVTASALMQQIVSPAVFSRVKFKLSSDSKLGRDEIISALEQNGYIRTTLVEEVGQVAVRGAVVDFFPPGTSMPIRIEMFGNTLESLRSFDPSTQRSVASLSEFNIIPVSETLLGAVAQSDGGRLISEVASSIERLRVRAQELEIPNRQLEVLIEAVRSGSSYPGLEHLAPLLLDTTATFWDYVPNNAHVVVYDEIATLQASDAFEHIVSERAVIAEQQRRIFPNPKVSYCSADDFSSKLHSRADCYFDSVELLTVGDSGSSSKDTNKQIGTGSERVRIYSNQELVRKIALARNKEKPFQDLASDILARMEEGVAVAIVISHKSRLQRVVEVLANYNIACVESELRFPEWRNEISKGKDSFSNTVSVIYGMCGRGIRVPDDRFMLLLETEIFKGIVARPPRGASKNIRRFLGSQSQLTSDDFIVHVEHGVGIYRGLRELVVEGKLGDFLHLEYAGGAKLFVPVDNIGKVQKYIGSEGKNPKLTKLGGQTWEKAKSKIKENVQALAGELVSIYASRSMAKGFSFAEVDEEDMRFADLFPFTETQDQQNAIDDVLRDMTSSKPMDRLVCGDVGYGKTEVAIRAAFKAVMTGKQVVILVPTTVLADQHFATFKDRFSDYPVEIRCVSRFSTNAQNKQSLQAVSDGKVDIVIGTHRLLQRDVFFKDLGLVIIDEEHRFGVAHKEKLKRFKREVDVLTLSATPIPRTLNMSMVGIKDLSVIETPPSDRHLIRTYISPYADGVVREAVMREIGRKGQVFYIHNRVSNIALIASELSELVPEARIEFAHGQMKEKELEVIMHKFLNREIDVLVSTTIVESGLDIANANTIIIRSADKFGLAELYQLRGRVGRSSRRAYAYLLIRDPKVLGPDAKKRLQVLQSLDDLGMGFRLALQDMEIRGAGNLLGSDQSGQVNLVGFELYNKILKEAVAEITTGTTGSFTGGEERRVPRVDPEMHIGFPAHIPVSYIPDVAERLILYQRLVELRDEMHGRELRDEIEDRFGHVPDEVDTLVELMVYRSLLRRAAIVSASFRNSRLTLAFHPDSPLDGQEVIKAVMASRGAWTFSPEMVMKAVLPEDDAISPGDLHRHTARILSEIGATLQ